MNRPAAGWDHLRGRVSDPAAEQGGPFAGHDRPAPKLSNVHAESQPRRQGGYNSIRTNLMHIYWSSWPSLLRGSVFAGLLA